MTCRTGILIRRDVKLRDVVLRDVLLRDAIRRDLQRALPVPHHHVTSFHVTPHHVTSFHVTHLEQVVRVVRFELTTSCAQGTCATRLRYTLNEIRRPELYSRYVQRSSSPLVGED